MNIYSWNVNGIRSIAKKGFEKWFSEVQADILRLQEVRADLDQIPESLQNPEGYFFIGILLKKRRVIVG